MPHSRQYGRDRPGKTVRERRRYPTAEQPGRSTTAGMHPQEIEAFMAGTWVSTYLSTYISSARFVPDPDESVDIGVLEVIFANDGVGWYWPCSKYDAWQFALAPSKGGWIFDTYRKNNIRGAPI